MTVEPRTDYGAAIRHIRKKVLHMTQPELAAALGCAVQTVCRWETGRKGCQEIEVPITVRLAIAALADGLRLKGPDGKELP